MGKLAIFAFGILVGIAATLAWQDTRSVAPATVVEPKHNVTTTDSHSVVDSSPRLEPEPVLAAPPNAPTTVATEEPPSLDSVLADPNRSVETLVIGDETFLGGPAESLMQGDDFSRFVFELSRSPSVAAAENFHRLSDEYHRLAAVRDGSVAVQQIACGRRVCAVSLAGYDRAGIDAVWAEITDSPARGPRVESGAVELKMRGGTITASTVVTGPNGFERRLLISVDPAIRAYTSGSIEVDPDP